MPRRQNMTSPFGDAPSGFYPSDVRELPEEFDRGAAGDLHYDDAGGVEIDLGDGDDAYTYDEPEEQAPSQFDDNLADRLDESEQVQLGMQLWEYVEIDIESRRTWE